MLDRGDYFQLAYVIPKGAAERIKEAGLPAFRQTLAKALPFLADRVDELKSWDDVKLLTVSIDRLRTWYKPGLLCIGDAAHAMSPVGGVGINLAIQDAVAAANILWKPLKNGTLTTFDLARVQHRRTFPTRVTQRLQVLAQNRVVQPVLRSTRPLEANWFMRLMDRTAHYCNGSRRASSALVYGLSTCIRPPRPRHDHGDCGPAGELIRSR